MNTKTTTKLNKYINEITPQILQILQENKKGMEYNLKKDGSLNKKCNDKIEKLIGYGIRPKTIRVWISTSEHHGLLKFDIYYKNSDRGAFSTSYIKDHVYLWSNDRKWCDNKREFVLESSKVLEFTPKTIKTEKQVIKAQNKINSINDKIELLNKELNKIKNNNINYIK
jgi:ribosomal protein L24E